jgi:DNA processing protein
MGANCFRDAEAPYAAALASLPGAGPATLARILGQMSPREAWEEVFAGRLERSGAGGRPRGQQWATVARKIDPPVWWRRFQQARFEACGNEGSAVGVTWLGHPDYPERLVNDPDPAGVLFWTGSLQWLKGRCVAIVGTRRATPDGRAVAFAMGRDLAAAGVCVVSGLALGIDAAAHRGSLSVAGAPGAAGPAGIAASGVDTPYPPQHTQLWEHVGRAGVMVSEAPPGWRAERWRFLVRNRIIAGLCDLVVVVESYSKGGSLTTAEMALQRGREVRAVPGPILSAASSGTNQLIYDGAGIVRDAQDVLDALGLILPVPHLADACASDLHSRGTRGDERAAKDPSALGEDVRAVLDVLGWVPSSLNQIVERSGLGAAAALCALDQLQREGLAAAVGGWWSRSSAGQSRSPQPGPNG